MSSICLQYCLQNECLIYCTVKIRRIALHCLFNIPVLTKIQHSANCTAQRCYTALYHCECGYLAVRKPYSLKHVAAVHQLLAWPPGQYEIILIANDVMSEQYNLTLALWSRQEMVASSCMFQWAWHCCSLDKAHISRNAKMLKTKHIKQGLI